MRCWSCLLVVLLGPLTAGGESIQLPATQDTTLYEHSSGRLANGAGIFLFAGRTGQEGSARSVRRSLLTFDLEQIPQGATVTHAELSLSVSKSAAIERHDVSVHRVLAGWSEGLTDAAVINAEEGQGDLALDGDTTWLHREKPDVFWTAPGGDYRQQASAIRSVAGEGRYSWGEAGELVEDVQFWIDHPQDNFGWLLRGDEMQLRTARRFNARTHGDLASRPALVVRYAVPEPSGKMILWGVAGILFIFRPFSLESGLCGVRCCH